MIGPLAVLAVVARLVAFDPWCAPVIHVPGELPRPAPLYSSRATCPGAVEIEWHHVHIVEKEASDGAETR